MILKSEECGWEVGNGHGMLAWKVLQPNSIVELFDIAACIKLESALQVSRSIGKLGRNQDTFLMQLEN
jgi:hypothetical protein